LGVFGWKFPDGAAKSIDPQTSFGAGIDRHLSAEYGLLSHLKKVTSFLPEIYGTHD
jgi:hypothetical protein